MATAAAQARYDEFPEPACAVLFAAVAVQNRLCEVVRHIGYDGSSCAEQCLPRLARLAVFHVMVQFQR